MRWRGKKVFKKTSSMELGLGLWRGEERTSRVCLGEGLKSQKRTRLTVWSDVRESLKTGSDRWVCKDLRCALYEHDLLLDQGAVGWLLMKAETCHPTWQLQQKPSEGRWKEVAKKKKRGGGERGWKTRDVKMMIESWRGRTVEKWYLLGLVGWRKGQ